MKYPEKRDMSIAQMFMIYQKKVLSGPEKVVMKRQWNYFKMPISNGAVEGLNNKAKVIAHRAYGYHTFETHKIALYLGMGKLPRPENVFRFL